MFKGQHSCTNTRKRKNMNGPFSDPDSEQGPPGPSSGSSSAPGSFGPSSGSSSAPGSSDPSSGPSSGSFSAPGSSGPSSGSSYVAANTDVAAETSDVAAETSDVAADIAAEMSNAAAETSDVAAETSGVAAEMSNATAVTSDVAAEMSVVASENLFDTPIKTKKANLRVHKSSSINAPSPLKRNNKDIPKDNILACTITLPKVQVDYQDRAPIGLRFKKVRPTIGSYDWVRGFTMSTIDPVDEKEERFFKIYDGLTSIGVNIIVYGDNSIMECATAELYCFQLIDWNKASVALYMLLCYYKMRSFHRFKWSVKKDVNSNEDFINHFFKLLVKRRIFMKFEGDFYYIFDN
jgi:hypothetical protein